jgi:hypothetical protein
MRIRFVATPTDKETHKTLSVGLRTSEIANLTWPIVLDTNGELGPTIALHDKAAKKGSGRSIPMPRNPDIENSQPHTACTKSGACAQGKGRNRVCEPVSAQCEPGLRQ